MRICNEPGCPALVESGYCAGHARARDKARGSRHERGYTNAWAKAAKAFLKRHKWCRHCERQGRQVRAQCVDHIEPHQGDRKMFWNRHNWQPLCNSCHSRKTRGEQTGKPIAGWDVSGMPLDPHWNRGG